MGQANVLRHMQRLIDSSRSKVTVCGRVGRDNPARDVLGIAGDSVLGALVDQTGGLVVADGYIKHLGGDNHNGDSVMRVNGLDPDTIKLGRSIPQALGALVVAVDALGGVFALPSDATDASQVTVRYLPYDSLMWEDFRIGHREFVAWSLGQEARELYPDEAAGSLATGMMLRSIPPLWMPVGTGKKRSMSVAPVPKVVRERIGMACAVMEATVPEGGVGR